MVGGSGGGGRGARVVGGVVGGVGGGMVAAVGLHAVADVGAHLVDGLLVVAGDQRELGVTLVRALLGSQGAVLGVEGVNLMGNQALQLVDGEGRGAERGEDDQAGLHVCFDG